jgi:hypothetical protein
MNTKGKVEGIGHGVFEGIISASTWMDDVKTLSESSFSGHRFEHGTFCDLQ